MMVQQAPPPFSPTDADPSRVKKILDDAKVTQLEVAEAARVSQSTVSRWLEGRRINPANLTKLYEAVAKNALSIPTQERMELLTRLLQQYEREQSASRTMRNAQEMMVEAASKMYELNMAEGLEAPLKDSFMELRSSYTPPPRFLGDRDLPVYSAAEGGPGEIVVTTDAIEWVPRPWFVENAKRAYAVLVTGTSMEPVYEAGDMVIVNPQLPAVRHKNHIFVADEANGEFRATVKRLTQNLAHEWVVQQYNPEREFKLTKREWPRALRIVGKFEG